MMLGQPVPRVISFYRDDPLLDKLYKENWESWTFEEWDKFIDNFMKKKH